VLLSENGEMAVLADFGLAERLPPDRDTYIDERRPGTTKFLSKEVINTCITRNSLRYSESYANMFMFISFVAIIVDEIMFKMVCP